MAGARRSVALHRNPDVAKHRLFVWCDARICPDHQLIVIARDDDTTFAGHVAFVFPVAVPPLVPRFGDQLQFAVTDPFGYPFAESLSPLGVFLQMVSGPYLPAAGVQNSLDGLFPATGP